MSDNLIVCQGLVKSYGHKAALTGIDLEVGRGRIVGLPAHRREPRCGGAARRA